MTMEEIREKVAAHEATLTQMNERLGHIETREEIICKSSCLCNNFCEPLFPNSLKYLWFCLYHTPLSWFSVPLLPGTHVQLDKLKHCDKLFQEKTSGASDNRPRLADWPKPNKDTGGEFIFSGGKHTDKPSF